MSVPPTTMLCCYPRTSSSHRRHTGWYAPCVPPLWLSSSHCLAPASVPPLLSLLMTTLYHRGSGHVQQLRIVVPPWQWPPCRRRVASLSLLPSSLLRRSLVITTIVVAAAIAVARIPSSSSSSCAAVALARCVLSSLCHHGSFAPPLSSVAIVVCNRMCNCCSLVGVVPPRGNNGQNRSVQELAQHGCRCGYRWGSVQGSYDT